MSESASSPSEENPLIPATGTNSGRAVLCVKCESLNPTDNEKCRNCQAHLYVFCQRCGGRNARVRSRCEHCQRSLHRSAGDRLKGTDSSISLLYLGLALLVILLVIVVLIWASDFRKA